MRLVFENLRTSEEREVAAFVASKGGVDKVLRSDTLLGDLLRLHRPREGPLTKSGPASGDDKSAVEEVRRDLSKDLEKIVEENRKTFDLKFDAQQAQIERVRDTVIKEGDRIIKSIINGPYERIVSKVRFLAFTQNPVPTSS